MHESKTNRERNITIAIKVIFFKKIERNFDEIKPLNLEDRHAETTIFIRQVNFNLNTQNGTN